MLPLLVFFVLYRFYGMTYAAGGLALATLVILCYNRFVMKRELDKFTMFSAFLAVFMGFITFVTDNHTFIKMKPTIFYSLCAALIIGGLFFDKVFIKSVFGAVLELNSKQWRSFSIHWIGFFTISAVVNEIIWRFYTEASWINFKVIFMPIIMILFIAVQVFRYRRHIVVQKTK